MISSWKNEVRSLVKLAMIEIVVGTGGSLLVFEDWRMNLKMAVMQSRKMIINHVTILLCVVTWWWLLYLFYEDMNLIRAVITSLGVVYEEQLAL